MPKYTIDGTTLSDVADAVRELDGNPDTMTPAQMASRIRAVQPGGADLSVIADDYDTTATYDVGDYCIHEGGLYVCTTAISTAEAWTAGHWEEVTVGDELSDLKSDLNQKYEKPSTGIPASDLASGVIPDLTDYVKNDDYADENNAGIVKSSSYYGTRMLPNGAIGIYRALTAGIKAGSDDYRPIVPYVQDVSTFYGLAKAAGDTTQSSSSNAVGVYTEEAKQAIRQMLGLPKNIYAELIVDTTTTEDLTSLTINTDSANNPFSLRKARIAVTYPPSTTGASSNIRTNYLNENANSANLGTAQISGNSSRFVFYDYEGFGAYGEVAFYTSSGPGNSATFGGSVGYQNSPSRAMTAIVISQYNSTSTLIPAGTHITIIGIRE